MPSANPFSAACRIFGCPDPVVRGQCAKHAQTLEDTRRLDTDRYLGREMYQSARWASLQASVVGSIRSASAKTVVHGSRGRSGRYRITFERTVETSDCFSMRKIFA